MTSAEETQFARTYRDSFFIVMLLLWQRVIIFDKTGCSTKLETKALDETTMFDRIQHTSEIVEALLVFKRLVSKSTIPN